MIEVNSKKLLLSAIQSGEQTIKIIDPKFLLACLVAQECGNDKNNVKKFLSLIQAKNSGNYNVDPSYLKIGLTQKKGKAKWLNITLSVCATSFGIMDVLRNTHTTTNVIRDENGFLTGFIELNYNR